MKHHDQHARLAFNEERALEDLQRLHREIQRARRQREQAESEFEQFVREPPEVQTPSAVATPPPRAIVPPPVKPPAVPSVAAPAPAVPRTPSPTLPPAAAPVMGKAVPAAPTPHPVPAAEVPAVSVALGESAAIHAKPTHRTVRWLLVLGPVAAAVMLVAVFGPRWWGAPATDQAAAPPAPARESAPGPAQSPAPGATQAPAAQPPAAPASTTPPEPAPPLLVEITTLRPVWLRATVDGRRLFERELPAGRQIPLRAERAVLLRAGDAGAVSVRVDGREIGPLGRDGAVANRLFEAPK